MLNVSGINKANSEHFSSERYIVRELHDHLHIGLVVFLVKVDAFVFAQLYVEDFALHFPRILKLFSHIRNHILSVGFFIQWVFCDIKVSVKVY